MRLDGGQERMNFDTNVIQIVAGMEKQMGHNGQWGKYCSQITLTPLESISFQDFDIQGTELGK